MQSPSDSTTPPSTIPTLTPTLTSASTSTTPPAATLAPLSNVLSALTLAPTSSITSNPETAVPSAPTATLASASTTLTPTVSSTSPWTSNWPSVPTVAFGSSAPSAEAATPTASWAGFSSQMDPQQLKFQIGPSSSGNPASPPGPASAPPTFSKPSASTSIYKVTGKGLFGSDIVTEASKAPGLFKFQSQTPAAPNRNVPVATPVRKLAGQARDTGAVLGRIINNAPRNTSNPGTSGQTQRSTIPNLGPDVIIRPVSSPRARNPSAAPRHNPPSLQGSEVFQLLAGYKYLKEEVASLKVQLANGQALMNEILNNFSSEVARINVRLTAVEREQETRRVQGSGREQGSRREQGTQREHGQGRIEEDRRMDGQGDRRAAEVSGNNNVDDVQESLSRNLGNLDIAKESNDE